MWECFNISPVVERDVCFQMLISFPVKPGVQKELREKATFSPPVKMWIRLIQFNSKTFYLICVP